MFRHSKFAVLLWLLAIALLPVRSANAHLHLCFDGREQPVSLHVEDVAAHHGENADGHQDRDVRLSDSMSTHKVGAVEDGPLAILGVVVFALLLPEPTVTLPQRTVLVPTLRTVFDLRPPTRGPPA